MNNKKQSKAILITAAVFLIIGAGCLIGGYLSKLGALMLVAILTLFIALILFLAGAVQSSSEKKAEKNVSNPNTLSYFTYGGNGSYEYFSAAVNTKSQNAKNVAVNVVGAVTMIFLGAGVFSYGQNVNDVFVSDKDIILNDKRKNAALDDRLFTVIHASEIKSIKVETVKKIQRVFIETYDGKTTALDIRTKDLNEANRVNTAFNAINAGEDKALKDFTAQINENTQTSAKFELTVNINGSDQKISEPSSRDLENVTSLLALSYENFAILECADTVNNFTFIQANQYDKFNDTVWVEAQLKVQNPKDFTKGITPDISDWKHITDII